MKTLPIESLLELYQPRPKDPYFGNSSNGPFISRPLDFCFKSEKGAFFFVTSRVNSDKDSPQLEQNYTVRVCVKPDRIDRVFDSKEFSSLSEATLAARQEAERNMPLQFYTESAWSAAVHHKFRQQAGAKYWLWDAGIDPDTPNLWPELERIHSQYQPVEQVTPTSSIQAHTQPCL